MISIALIMGFIAMAVGLIVGVMIYAQDEDSVDWQDAATEAEGNAACQKASHLAWTVIAILPISLFVSVFAFFGGMNNFLFR